MVYFELPGPFATQDPSTMDPDNLPMIVWLRGDESWFESFSVDADSAMVELGIRRSRLTQISGRELRVGKKRVDRYIRPVFRPQDIEAYKSMTRATISHLKSSRVIDEAMAKLENETGHLVEKVTAALDQRTGDFEAALDTLAHDVRHAQGLLLREVTDRIDRIERGLDGSLQAALHRVESALAGTSERIELLQKQSAANFETMLSLANQNHLLLRELQAATSARMETFARQITEHLARVEENATSVTKNQAEQVEMSVHQTRLAIRSDLKKFMESLQSQTNSKGDATNVERNHGPKNQTWTHYRRARSGGTDSRRLRFR
jgi:hypothetical protein